MQGIPLGVKDIIAAREGATTACSKVIDPDWGRGVDAPAVVRLRAQGGVITGKTTTMEFAMGAPGILRVDDAPPALLRAVRGHHLLHDREHRVDRLVANRMHVRPPAYRVESEEETLHVAGGLHARARTIRRRGVRAVAPLATLPRVQLRLVEARR